MLVIVGAIGGAIWGGYLARRRRGNHLDILQYAVASAIAFGLVALFASILLSRVLGQRASKSRECDSGLK